MASQLLATYPKASPCGQRSRIIDAIDQLVAPAIRAAREIRRVDNIKY